METLELRSTVTSDGKLRLSLEHIAIEACGPGDVIIRVEAAPINPSDQALLTGFADLSTLQRDTQSGAPVTTATIPPQFHALTASRVGKASPAGNEGAGTVIEAGENVKHLLGKIVSGAPGGMYTRYRRVPATGLMVFPDGVTALAAASSFVNPLTALGMISTMRREKHTALVHTAAASSLGQMLNKICLSDGVGLVNVVRNGEQANILEHLGAEHVVDSSAPDFRKALTSAIAETGATLAFDAVGGGSLAGKILAAMESALLAKGPSGPYGSPVHKQAYIYGRLDLSPTELPVGLGMAWGVGGWLLTPHLLRIAPEEFAAMRERVTSEITTTFATSYAREISLTEALDPEVMRAYQRKATGEKYVIVPSRV